MAEFSLFANKKSIAEINYLICAFKSNRYFHFELKLFEKKYFRRSSQIKETKCPSNDIEKLDTKYSARTKIIITIFKVSNLYL